MVVSNVGASAYMVAFAVKDGYEETCESIFQSMLVKLAFLRTGYFISLATSRYVSWIWDDSHGQL